MTYKYRYTGDVPTVFITLMKNGHTWVPKRDDTYSSLTPITHPLLELVVDAKPAVTESQPTVGQDDENSSDTKPADSKTR